MCVKISPANFPLITNIPLPLDLPHFLPSYLAHFLHLPPVSQPSPFDRLSLLAPTFPSAGSGCEINGPLHRDNPIHTTHTRTHAFTSPFLAILAIYLSAGYLTLFIELSQGGSMHFVAKKRREKFRMYFFLP